MAEGEIKVTAGAQRALDLAQVVNKVFAKERVGRYRIVMSAPDGPSTTDRARPALQFLKLVPQPAGGTEIVVGTIDALVSEARLRSHAHLSAVHGRRFPGEAFGVERAAYEALLEKVRAFFEREGIASRIVTDADSEASSAAAAKADEGRGGTKRIAMLAAVAFGLLALTLVIGWILRRG